MPTTWREFIFDGNLASGLCACPEDLDRIKKIYRRDEEDIDILKARMWGEPGTTPIFRFDGEGITLGDWLQGDEKAPGKKKLPFKIEPRAGVNVVVWPNGSIRPATITEIEMWNLLIDVYNYRHSEVIGDPKTEIKES